MPFSAVYVKPSTRFALTSFASSESSLSVAEYALKLSRVIVPRPSKFPDARSAMFELQKDAYLYGSSIFADEEGMMVPSSYAVQYALNELGFVEHSGPVSSDNKYNNPVAGEYSIYRDETCHLTLPYGRVLAGLTWYEYLTGNDARENPYTNDSVPAEIMVKLKEAAHYANTMVVPLTGSAK